MATWVRNLTGTAPSSAGADLTGAAQLDNATAPGDFDPAGVTSVRFQVTIRGGNPTTFVDDLWGERKRAGLWATTGSVTLASVDDTDAGPGWANVSRGFDLTDSSPSTSASTAAWESAEIRADGATTTSDYAWYSIDMKNDGASLDITAITVTITYTPAGTLAPPPFKNRRYPPHLIGR